MSIPELDLVSGSVILAEIGNYHDFKTPEQLAKWCGLSPGDNESAGKKRPCGITKQGSKYLRTMLVQIAHVVAGKTNTKLSGSFIGCQRERNTTVAITALARNSFALSIIC